MVDYPKAAYMPKLDLLWATIWEIMGMGGMNPTSLVKINSLVVRELTETKMRVERLPKTSLLQSKTELRD